MAKDLIRGAAIGAGLMYLLDPERGRRRRAMVEGKMTRAQNVLRDSVGPTSRDIRHRAKGMVAEARSRVRPGRADAPVLEERIRAELGRLVSNPGAIDVRCEDDHVTLSGPVLTSEADELLAGVESVRGVGSVESRLDVHERREDVPGLQGTSPRQRGHRPELMQSNWTPAARLLMGAVGGALTLRGLRKGGVVGSTLSATGLGLLSRAATNLEMKRLTGLGAGRRAIDIRKTINIDAPVAEVFDLWSHFDQFPRFMSHLREVRATGDGRSHWVAEAPGGVTFEWDAETTRFEENEVIAWKSVGDSPVKHAGIVRFVENENGGTRLDIRMSYNPPAGAIGHAAASFLGADPKHLMDEDLVRMQSLFENGKTSAKGHGVTRGEIVTGAS